MKLCPSVLLTGAFALLASAAVPPTVVVKRFDPAQLKRDAARVVVPAGYFSNIGYVPHASRDAIPHMSRNVQHPDNVIARGEVWNSSTPYTCEVIKQEIAGNLTVPVASDDTKAHVNEEEEQKIITEMMNNDPSLTLWDIFMLRAHKIGQAYKNSDEKAWLVFDTTAKFLGGLVTETIKSIADVFVFIGKAIVHPKEAGKSIGDWFKQLGNGIKALWNMMWHKPPLYTLEQVGGGIMLEITQDPDKFIAQTALLTGTGFAVLGGVMLGLETVLPTLPGAVGTAMMSALIFVHALDDPIIILSSILNVAVAGVTGLAGSNSTGEAATINGTWAVSTLLVPEGLGPTDPIPTFPTCMLPANAPGYGLTYGRFCSITQKQAQLWIFGTDKDPKTFTDADQVEAQKKFHDFACCYGPTKYTPPGFENSTVWKDAPTTIHDCTTLRGTYV